MAIDKIFYNEASATKLGWKPDWFGREDFDENLVDEIRKWQRRNGLKSDGLCGPSTFRRIFTERDEKLSEYKPLVSVPSSKHIIHNGDAIAINWDKVVLWSDEGGLKCEPGTYSSYSGKPDRKPHFFVNHWDVCLSAESCSKVLAKRGISVHFCIDNDGTIYQLLDTQHAAWQAGGRRWNHDSVGVEISNAYYTKYQDWYVKHGFGKRPVIKKGEAKVHGRSLDEHLDFYPIQLEALKALWAAMHNGLGIPLECPVDKSGTLVEAVDKQCEASRFEGIINHYNLTRRKIDCGGLDLKNMLLQTKKIV
jgi:hypothetical protein